ncbi:MAG: hypothetical protein CL878_04160 [Dehalococcoidia bacterium]|nr:hypothetical protein [Dehalococcoidia bacterium]
MSSGASDGPDTSSGAAPRSGADVAVDIDWDAVAGRPPPRLDMQRLTKHFAGRRALVTGAAGSLGWPLAAFLADLPLAELAILDAHEPSLFSLRRALGERAMGAASVRYVLADIRRPARVESLMKVLRPHVIFHLAACKHVPWAEDDPVEFVATNVLGTHHLVQAAFQQQVERIVYPSTDKAIAPPSLYGATKHLAEGMLRAAASAGGPSATICRFVNVLGSRGAASETFVQLIRENRALSITDPRMRRYWISPQHALVLLLHAPLLAAPLLTVVPDVEDELTPVDIAARIWQQLRPGEDGPPLSSAGARPGERLSEPLLRRDEHLAPSEAAGLRQVSSQPGTEAGTSVPFVEWERRCARLSSDLDRVPADELRATVFSWLDEDTIGASSGRA